ncbi:triose-phosphate isomerase [Candidatus Liberibacter sp.]|uniref:triose-phosphate isomerase n=1 Tax=Candidatus Liberibacter sp. TaxID=34022 RepID=UPI0015F5E83E|nr:triose-phosphate isomerase [Candidatus Liberibacter sp.]MBA5723881.1 triose-phosphate isomerase [Candidatus Liberibacter sp.]
MTSSIRPLVMGNWKMHGLRVSLAIVEKIVQFIDNYSRCVDVVVCPPTTLTYLASRLCEKSSLMIGAQDCHVDEYGAYTGDISANMLADCGASFAILGHSERRIGHRETCAIVQAKVKVACRIGLVPVVCIGETADDYRSGRTLEILQEQLECSLPDEFGIASSVIAYEPVWAIGTGLVPSGIELEKIHSFIRRVLLGRFAEQGQGMRILYGGSVNVSNVNELLSIDNINGVLVGGASLKDQAFIKIIEDFGYAYADSYQ